MSSENPTRPAELSRLLLWFAFLGSPVAWGVHIGARYPLVPTACALELPWVLHGVTILTLSVTVGSMLAALTIHRRARRDTSTKRPALLRIQYMAFTGLLLGLLFALVIVAELVPALMQDPCLDVRL